MRMILPLSFVILAAYWLPRLVVWILQPDYIAPHMNIDAQIDRWNEIITGYSPTTKGTA